MESKEKFGSFIQQKRKEKKLTQKEFAQQLFITESAISKWERGLTYPDITLVRDICEVLKITEHELLTASEDVRARNNEKIVTSYLRNMALYKKISFRVYGGLLLACMVSNLIATHNVTWFFLVLASVLVVASLTLLPVMVTKYQGVTTLIGFTCSTIFLLFVCHMYRSGNWFFISVTAFLLGICLIFLPYVFSMIALPQRVAKFKALLCLLVDTILVFLLIFAIFYSSDDVKQWLLLTAYWLLLPWGVVCINQWLNLPIFFRIGSCLGWSTIIFSLSRWVFLMVNSRLFDVDSFSFTMTAVTLFGLMCAFFIAGIIERKKTIDQQKLNGNSTEE